MKVGNCLIVGMIGGDLRDQTGKFAALMTIKQIDQAGRSSKRCAD
jgi:hypothetical protein